MLLHTSAVECALSPPPSPPLLLISYSKLPTTHSLTPAHANSCRHVVDFIDQVGSVLTKKTLPTHRARANEIYAAMIGEPAEASICRLGGLEEGSARALAHGFGSVAAVIQASAEQQLLVDVGVSSRDAAQVGRFVVRNKVV